MKIVIAGASSGIGRHLAERLAASGHQVWRLARSCSPGNGVSKRGRSSVCDVADWAQVARVVDEIRGDPDWGHIQALIICAARQGPVGPTVALDPAAWSATVRVNLDGTFHLIRAFYESLCGAGRGRAKVLCFSGGGASKPRANFSAYAASKTAVVRLVENLAEEWRGQPIDINAIAPGALPTAMTEEVLRLGATVAGEAEVAAAQRTLAETAAAFARLDGLVDFLLSAASDGISGKFISAPWDEWETFGARRAELEGSDSLTLRRITPPADPNPGGKA